MGLQARQRKDLLDGMVAIPHLESREFAVIKAWHEAIEDEEGAYRLYKNGEYIGTFASIDLEFKG